jgi:hypothetical protein
VEPAEFLVEQELNWCYYYAKADLARQYKEWEQVLALEAEARQNGFEAENPFDLLPFIEAHAMTSNFETAKALSMRAIKDDARIRVGVCKVWERVQTEGPEGGEAEAFIADSLNEFQCTQ